VARVAWQNEPVIGSRAGFTPKVPQTVRLAPGAHVLGNVVLGEHCVIDCGAVITSDLDIARRHLAQAGFFGHVFEFGDDDPADLHRRSVELLRREAADGGDAVPRTKTDR
jgi:hypothetical protein